MIVDQGVVVATYGDVTRKFRCHSLRKSFLSALIGIHVRLGNINLESTLKDLNVDDIHKLSKLEMGGRHGGIRG